MGDYITSSAFNFRENYKQSFLNYQKYGKVVLDIDLKDNEKLKEIFLRSENLFDYLQNMNAFWVDNYQLVIKKCSDIEEAYKCGAYHEDIPLISDISDPLANYKFVVSEDFYDCLWKRASLTLSAGSVYIETDNFIYWVELYNQDARSIKIHSERISKESIIRD